MPGSRVMNGRRAAHVCLTPDIAGRVVEQGSPVMLLFSMHARKWATADGRIKADRHFANPPS